MRRPPRPLRARLFGIGEIAAGLGQGLVILVAVLWLYLGLLPLTGETAARGSAYAALAVANLALALANAASAGVGLFSPHRRLFWSISAGLALVLLGGLYLPLVADLFRFSEPDFPHLALAVGVGLLAGGWSGALRALRRRRF